MKGEEDSEYPPELGLPRWAAEPKRRSRTWAVVRACAYVSAGLLVGLLVHDTGVAKRAVPSHPLVDVLLPGGGGVRPDSHGARFNVTVCALATNEARFLPEWVTFHRMAGVERFYLYDSNNDPKTAEALLPFIEDGSVVLHHMQWPESMIHGAYFHHSMFSHCEDKYSSSTEWLGSWDVDEFMLFQPPAHLHTVPYLSQADDSPANASSWLFPLHDYLSRDYLYKVRAMPLGRDLTFIGVGVEDLAEDDLVTQRIVHRRIRSLEPTYGKIMLHAAYQPKPLATWIGAHQCESRETAAVEGVAAHGANVMFKDPFGHDTKDCVATKFGEPLRIAHFGMRSLQDCFDKFDAMEKSYPNERTTGGYDYCRKMFQATIEQQSSASWRVDHPEQSKISVETFHFLVDDYSVRSSWLGIQTANVEDAWHAAGGRRMSEERKAAALAKIVALDFGQLQYEPIPEHY